jgi:hypothetical protein
MEDSEEHNGRAAAFHLSQPEECGEAEVSG